MDHQPQSPGSDSDRTIQVHNKSIVVPATASLISIADSFEKKEHSWFVTSQIPTDLSIQVQDITFYVHKFPLVSRCGYLANTDLQPNDTNLGYDIKLENFPGGSETFEIVLRFCYGLPVGLNPKNVAALRCASEYLDMTEAQEEGNLISKTEVFLTFVVLSSWRDSITVLKSCETLSPWAENLQIVRRCGDSIAWNVSREKDTIEEIVNDEFWWFDDMVTLRIDHFMRIMTAVRAKGLKPEIIGACIMRYAEKRLKGLGAKNEMEWCILNGRRQGGGVGHGKEQRMIVESLVSILPPEKEAVSCKFLAWMLKMAITCSASTALIFELEKRVGMVLENANVDDLLIPNYILGDPAKQENSSQEQTMHNVDAVQRILEYFLMHEQQHQRQKPGKLNISKLLDSYLAEIAKDPNLSITKFQVLAEAMPENVRKCDDGLYRAIDTYLKTHPSLSDHDRRRLCKVMHCEKLSLDACMHAAQNDRLPLRTIIQVLFSEQVKMRTAVQGKEITESSDNSEQESSWPSTKKEIKALKSELEKVKIKMTELQKDHSELQQEYVKLNHKQRRISSWSLGWSKIKKHAVLRGKIIGEEIDEGRQRSNSISRKLGFLRRRSIS